MDTTMKEVMENQEATQEAMQEATQESTQEAIPPEVLQGNLSQIQEMMEHQTKMMKLHLPAPRGMSDKTIRRRARLAESRPVTVLD